MARNLPNIAITGTPGVGKSKFARRLIDVLPNSHLLDINSEAKKSDLYEARDVDREAWIIDTHVLDATFSPRLIEGGCVIDWMHADFWDPTLVDLVITLRANNTVLYDRYALRSYPNAKIQENLDSEIMNEIGQANLEYFENGDDPEEQDLSGSLTEVVELTSETEADCSMAIDSTLAWYQKWITTNGGEQAVQRQKVPFIAV